MGALHARSGRGLIVAIALATSWGALGLAPGAAAGSASRSCLLPRHAHVLARGSLIYAWSERGKPDRGNITTSVFACSRPHGRSVLVVAWTEEEGAAADSGESQGAEDVQADGSILGLDDSETDESGGSDQLIVIDVKSGRTLLNKTVGNVSYQIDSPTQCSPCFGGYTIDAAGDVAWEVSNGTDNSPQPFEGTEALHLKPVSGAARTLATATTIGDVVLSGGSISWVADGLGDTEPIAGGSPTTTGPTGATGSTSATGSS
jgi:hypothetical protein